MVDLRLSGSEGHHPVRPQICFLSEILDRPTGAVIAIDLNKQQQSLKENIRAETTMPTTNMHPNSQAMLDAWQRMTAKPEDLVGGPPAEDYPGLLGCLFILQGGFRDKLPFRIAGDDLADRLGRNLIGSNFLDIWAEEDRPLLKALIEKVLSSRQPGLVHAKGFLRGRETVGIEVVFAPLDKTGVGRDRILALYQVLGNQTDHRNNTIGLHKLTALYPPEPQEKKASLRLVACND